jgi:glutaredoxin-related protein
MSNMIPHALYFKYNNTRFDKVEELKAIENFKSFFKFHHK